MPQKVKVLCVIGTRPEAIKMAPVVAKLKQASWCDVKVLSSAQHGDLLASAFETFGIQPDFELAVMEAGQSLHSLTAKILSQSEPVLRAANPDIVLVHGDTTTAFCLALSAFYLGIKVGHVEAGLRTNDISSPFPEEANRSIIGRLAALHFAPTPETRSNLVAEGVAPESVVVTGNTVIDALMLVSNTSQPPDAVGNLQGRLVMITAHRRENIGDPFVRICTAIRLLAERYAHVWFVFALHPNPVLQKTAHAQLSGINNVILVAPMEYGPFIASLKRSALVLSDSGGVQEEAPAMGVPVVLLRDTTERPEAVRSGLVELVGTNIDRIVAVASQYLDRPESVRTGDLSSPYGDGSASDRIVEAIRLHFDVDQPVP